jgi:hypothetical protein
MVAKYSLWRDWNAFDSENSVGKGSTLILTFSHREKGNYLLSLRERIKVRAVLFSTQKTNPEFLPNSTLRLIALRR